MEGDRRRATRETTNDGQRAAGDDKDDNGDGRAEAKAKWKGESEDGRSLSESVVCSRNGRGVEGQRRRWSVAVWSVACSRNGRGPARSEARASSEGVRIPNFNSNSQSVILILDIVFEVSKNVNPRESPCPRVQI